MNSNKLTAKFLTFTFDCEEYAIDISHIQEIKSFKSLTGISKIATAPRHIRGILQLNNDIITIIDLRTFYNLKPLALIDYQVVIIFNFAQKCVGIIVDAVTEIVELGLDTIKSAPDFFSVMHQDYIKGICNYENHLLIILDIEKFIFSEQLQVTKQSELT